MANHPPEWKHQFTSDNASGMIQDLFETECDVFFVNGGTAANALALSTLCASYHGLIAHQCAHTACDETNAPEFFTGGMKIVDVEGHHGKIDPSKLPSILQEGDRIHSAKMRAITLTQATEAGTVYTVDEIRAITRMKTEFADLDLKVHMDGARFANAMAAQPNITPKEMTWQSGVDVLTFGATKNGAPASEANMVFTILPERLASGLKQRGSVLIHYAWFSATRFRCNWGTTDEAVEAILADARELLDA